MLKRMLLMMLAGALVSVSLFAGAEETAGEAGSDAEVKVGVEEEADDGEEADVEGETEEVEKPEVAAAPKPVKDEARIRLVSTDPADYPAHKADFEFGVQESEAAEHAYFDDAVFIGDSISLKLSYYVRKMRKTDAGFMGKAKFLVAGSLGSGNALWEVGPESVHPSYQGKKMLLEDGVKAIGAKKVYIMLGINDVALYGVEGSVENMKKLIGRILEKSPEAEIFVQSATPRIAAMKSRPTNKMIFEYDLKLYDLCVENGWNYIDVASVMRDENGNLFDAYCSDVPTMGMHFTDEACQIWVDYLLTHTVEVEESKE